MFAFIGMIIVFSVVISNSKPSDAATTTASISSTVSGSTSSIRSKQNSSSSGVSRDYVRKDIFAEADDATSTSNTDGTWSMGGGSEDMGSNIKKNADEQTKAIQDKKRAAEEAAAQAKAKADAEAAQKRSEAKASSGDSSDQSVGTSSSTITAPTSDIQSYAHDKVITSYGWSEDDFTALVWLWNRESGWNPNSVNASSGASGIPQCLGHAECQTADYKSSYKVQVDWGLNYISNRYGTPSSAKSHSVSTGWY
jgi:predicted  nucleic acid-binding Zn-ribbon protein